MNQTKRDCVLLADRNHGLTEGMRDLLMSAFDTVVMVADEISLFDSADRMEPNVVPIDLSLADGDGLGLIARWRIRFPLMRLIILGLHDDLSVAGRVIDAGADAFVLKRTIATDLLDAVASGKVYLSPAIDDLRVSHQSSNSSPSRNAVRNT